MSKWSDLLSGSGCIIVFLAALLALAYVIYARYPLRVVYQADDAQDTLKQVQTGRYGGRGLDPPMAPGPDRYLHIVRNSSVLRRIAWKPGSA